MSTTPEKTGHQLGAKIRKRRKKQNLTLQALCDASGVSVGYLSQVERDNATPSLGTLAQIADALGVRLEYFIASHKPTDGLTREDHRPRFALANSSLTYEALASDFAGSELSSYLLHVPVGYTSEAVSHEGEEIIYVLEGEIQQTLGDQVFLMKTGDCLHYSGETPHTWSNPSDTPARILWTGTLTVLSRIGAAKHPKLPDEPEAV